MGWFNFFVGLAIVALSMPISSALASKHGKSYFSLMKYRDERSKLLSEALEGIRHIRLGALEQYWEGKIIDVRTEEMRTLWQGSLAMCLLVLVANLGPILMSAVPLSLFAIHKGQFTASATFTTIGLFEKLQESLSNLPLIWTYMLESRTCCERLEKFLKSPESNTPISSSDVVCFNTATVFWPRSGDNSCDDIGFSLNALSLEFPKGGLSLIAGGTGSGKNLLLNAIFGEVALKSGSIASPLGNRVASDGFSNIVGLVSQPPWLERATVRENILFGSRFDSARYNRVVRACALERDINGFSHGDLTDVGPKGISLSGGQRWRICLARALYSEAETIVMGDILSAVDAEVRQWLVDNALTGELTYGRTRIMATHHVEMCKPISNFLVQLSNGDVVKATTMKSTSRAEMTQASTSKAPQPQDDKPGLDRKSATSKEGSQEKDKDKATESAVAGGGVSSASDYLRTAGYLRWAWVFVVILVSEPAALSQGWWLKRWTHAVATQEDQLFGGQQSMPTIGNRNQGTYFYVGAYLLLSITSSLMSAAWCYVTYVAAQRSAKTIFRRMIRSVLTAPLHWLDTTPRGQILNRFTSDMITVDLRLPHDLSYGIVLLVKLGLIVATG